MSREAFGKPLAKLGGNTEQIAKARIEIESMRLMVLQAVRAMDVLPMREARVWVSAVKALVPKKVCDIIDQAIQMHGGLGVSQYTSGYAPAEPAAEPGARPNRSSRDFGP